MLSCWVGRPVRVRLAGFVLLLALFGLGVPQANAAIAGTSYIPLSNDTFGLDQTSVLVNGVGDVAVSQATGNIFVADPQFSGDIGIYSATPGAPGGASLTTAGSTIVTVPSNVAVDSVDDTVYLDDAFNSPGLDKLVSDGQPTPTYTPDPGFASSFFAPQGLAVDPATRDLIVLDSGSVFRVSRTDGTVLDSFGSGTLQSPTAVAVAPNGAIYVVNAGDGSVRTFSSAGTPTGALALPVGAAASTVAVNPADGRVVVYVTTSGAGSLEGFSSAGARLFSAALPASFTNTNPTPPSTSTISTAGHGLAWDGNSDRIYLSLGQGLVVTLVAAVQPGVDGPAVTSSGYNTAHVTARIDAGGVNTTARFEYCPASQACSDYASSNPADSHNPWKRSAQVLTLAGNGEVTIEDDLPLTSNMQWRIRLVAQTDPDSDGNLADGVSSTSSTTSYITPLIAPVVETGAATSVTTTEALLSGTIDPIGDPTSYHFEYGLTMSYGSRVPVTAEAIAGSNRIPRTVSRSVAGLTPGTTYHYRLVGRNGAGTTAGADRTFTTDSGEQLLSSRRGYEQVTPVDKKGAQVRYDFHFQAAPDGSAFVPVTRAAASDADSSNLLENYITYRDAKGWSYWQPVDPPLNAATGLFEATTSAISADFKHALVISNRALAPGGIDNGGNLYVRDLRDNSYTFVAGSPGTPAFAALANAKQNTTVLLAAAPDFSWIVFNFTRYQEDPSGRTVVYRWTRSGGLSLESVMPDGTLPLQRTQAYASGPQKWVSEDGKVVYFGLEDGGNGGSLYRRADGQTTPVSVSHNPGLPLPNVWPVRLSAVSRDGRYSVFYTKQGVPLTSDSPSGATNAYRYDSQDDVLVYLGSIAQTGADGLVAAVSDDAQTIYLVTRDAGFHPTLKVWHSGVLRTIANTAPGGATVSSNGRYFAWVAEDGTAHVYDRDTDDAACISCTADGSPHGTAHLRSGEATISNRLPQVVLDDGTVFFDTPGRLVTADHNGSQDVYSYKNGRVTLISPGDGDYDAVFMDASVDGRDVFFATPEGLVPQDTDRQYDVYDARVGGGFPSPTQPPPPCIRSNCGEQSSGPVTSPRAPSSNVDALTSKSTNQTKPRMKVGKVSFGSKTVRITFTASEGGRVTVSGARVAKTVRNLAKSGTYTMSVRLSRKAQAMRHVHRKFKVSLKVSLYSGFGLASAKYSRTLGK
jgi:hypothetical protein